MKADENAGSSSGYAGAFGINYALRPHKFVDRRLFMEVLSRFSNFLPLQNHAYVGLGSFAMEDHKLVNASFGTQVLISLEVEPDVVARQRFNAPLSCITATQHSTDDFVLSRAAILKEGGASPEANVIAWFDMTDAQPVSVYLDTFASLLREGEIGDFIRFTVDVDGKTLARKREDEKYEVLRNRRFDKLRELLGTRLKRGATPQDLDDDLGIARLILHAFELATDEVFHLDARRIFEPLSLTTYADGHRMLSVSGSILGRDTVQECRARMHLENVPGGAGDWEALTNIQIPQLTVWEKLSLDRRIPAADAAELAAMLNFRLHETIETTTLLSGYSTFHRFYPNFRHFVL